jgi:hypothetical protein
MLNLCRQYLGKQQRLLPAGWCGDNAVHYNSGGAQFESQEGHRLPSYDFLGFPKILQANARRLSTLVHEGFFPNSL